MNLLKKKMKKFENVNNSFAKLHIKSFIDSKNA